ncbi:MAG: hypothetical protein QNJ51_22240 [Calothrix sp. MO_167.B12]|nr:hypothetical protein [Calothrix sp. MO_167.B12]
MNLKKSRQPKKQSKLEQAKALFVELDDEQTEQIRGGILLGFLGKKVPKKKN